MKTPTSDTNSINWITGEQVQRKLNISRSTLYRWVKNNALRAYRFSHSRITYYNEAEIDRFLSLNPITHGGRLDKTIFVETPKE